MNLICNGTALEVTVAGSGEPVLIIHGFTGSALAMKSLADRLPGRRIVPDLIGHGRSESPVSLTAYNLDAVSQQLSSLLEQLNATPTAIVGYSMGGRVALNFAVNHPEKVRSLTLIGASPGIESDSDRLDRKDADNKLAASISDLGVKAFIESWVDMPMWESLRNKLTATQWQESIAERQTNHPLGLANSLRASGTGNMNPLHEALRTLKVPTLLLVGDKDQKFLQITHDMSTALPNASIQVIADSGHATHLEQPDATATAIIEQLSCS